MSGSSSNFDPPNESAAQAADVYSLWAEFTTKYQTKESCVEELYRRGGSALLRCHHCRQPLEKRKHGARAIECLRCRKETWPMAGTFFHRMKVPRAWLAVIWFLEHGVVLNAWTLHELVGITSSSAFSLLKKFATVIREEMPDDAMTVPSGVFYDLFWKRSRETPARRHPSAEEDDLYSEEADNSSHGNGGGEANASTPVNGDCTQSSSPDTLQDLGQLEREICLLLSDEPMSLDVLYEQARIPVGTLSATLMMLELANLVIKLPGSLYVRAAVKQSKPGMHAISAGELGEEALKSIGDTMQFIASTWHGISRKYLQNYLAVFWCVMDTARWPRGALFDACLKFGPVFHEQTIAYVTPPIVKIFVS